jgi:hypothetical protein
VLILALGLGASLAEAQNLGVGAPRDEPPPHASVGGLRDVTRATAGVGGFAGSFPASTSSTEVPGLAGPSGAFSGNLMPSAPLGGLPGSIPADAPSGAPTPGMPSASFGPPTPADIARRNEGLGKVHLIDRSNASADSALDRSTAIREQAFGAKDPGVGDGLEGQARLLERYQQSQARPGVDERSRADKAACLQERHADPQGRPSGQLRGGERRGRPPTPLPSLRSHLLPRPSLRPVKEVTMDAFDVQGIAIKAPYDRAFRYVADPLRLPEWTRAFEAVADGRATLRTGAVTAEVGLTVEASLDRGTVDWTLVFPDGSVARAFSRLVPAGPNRTVYSFVLLPPPVPLAELEGTLAEQSRILRAELAALRARLETP